MALNKEFLSGLGVSEEAIQSIIAEHGKGIQAEQNKTAIEKTRADNAATQLNEASEKLKGYDPEWQSKVANAKKDADSKIEKMRFDHALNSALQSAGVKNAKAVTALIDKDLLKLNGDELVGLDSQIKRLKESDGYLFNSGEKPKLFTKNTNSGASQNSCDARQKANDAIRAAFGRNN